MAKQKQDAPAPQNAESQSNAQQIQLHIAPDLEYCYRDLFSIYAGAEEVILELGNRHRSASNRGTVGNRIVLSIPNAFRLHQALGQTLSAARQRFQARRAAQADTGEGDNAGTSDGQS